MATPNIKGVGVFTPHTPVGDIAQYHDKGHGYIFLQKENVEIRTVIQTTRVMFAKFVYFAKNEHF